MAGAGALAHQVFRHEGKAGALAFTPDGKILVGYTNSGIHIWDATTGKELHRLSVRRPSEDGTTLAISENALGDDEAKVSPARWIGG
jgi:WD40 repeat protein